MKVSRKFWTGTEKGKALLIDLFEDLWPDLFRSAERMTGDTDEAEDIVATAFEKLLKFKGDFQSRADVRGWLNTIVNHDCIDLLRKRATVDRNKYMVWMLTIENSPSESPFPNDPASYMLKEITRRIEALPKGCKEVFLLSYLEELKNREIAERLGISEKTVRNQLYTARKQLKEFFSKTPIEKSWLISILILPLLSFFGY